MQIISTNQLALAARMLSVGDRLCPTKPFSTITHGPKKALEFHIETDHPERVDEFHSGADGVVKYETCRRALLRIIIKELGEPRI